MKRFVCFWFLVWASVAFGKDLFVVRDGNNQLKVVDVVSSSVSVLLAVDIEDGRYDKVFKFLSEFVQIDTSLGRFQKSNRWISEWKVASGDRKAALKDTVDVVYGLVRNDPGYQLMRVRWENNASDVDRFVLAGRHLIFRSTRTGARWNDGVYLATGVGKKKSIDAHTMGRTRNGDSPWQSYSTKMVVAEVGYNRQIEPSGELNSDIVAVDAKKLLDLRRQGKREVYFLASSLFDRLIASLRGTDATELNATFVLSQLRILENPSCSRQHDVALDRILTTFEKAVANMVTVRGFGTSNMTAGTVLDIDNVTRLGELRKASEEGLRDMMSEKWRRFTTAFLDLVDYRIRWLQIHKRGKAGFWLRFYQWTKQQEGQRMSPERFVKALFSGKPFKTKRDPFVRNGEWMVDQSGWDVREQAFFDELEKAGIPKTEAVSWLCHEGKTQRHNTERKHGEVLVFHGLPSDLIVGSVDRVNHDTERPYPLLMPRFLSDTIHGLRRAIPDVDIVDPHSLPGKPALVTYRVKKGRVGLMPRGLLTKPMEELVRVFHDELKALGRVAPKTTVFGQDREMWLSLELAAYERALEQLAAFEAELPKSVPDQIPESDLKTWDRQLGLGLTRFVYATGRNNGDYDVFSRQVVRQRVQEWLTLTRAHLAAMRQRIAELENVSSPQQYETVMAHTRMDGSQSHLFFEDGYYDFRPVRGVGVPKKASEYRPETEVSMQLLQRAKRVLDEKMRMPIAAEIGHHDLVRRHVSQSRTPLLEAWIAQGLGFESERELFGVLLESRHQARVVPLLEQLDGPSQEVVRTLFDHMMENGRIMTEVEIRQKPELSASYDSIKPTLGGVEEMSQTFARMAGFEDYAEFRSTFVLRLLDRFYQEQGRFIREVD